jgi:murein DD-endopeptidase MepM/ murein hydrolase activator NlpD
MNVKQADLREDYLVEEGRFQPKVLKGKASNHTGLKIGLAVAVILVAVLGWNVIKLQYQTQQEQQERSKLLSQISDLKTQVDEGSSKLNAVTASSDSTNNRALTYIESIQSKLTKINDYLSRRGLRGVSFRTVNTNTAKGKKASPVELYAKYNNYLAQLVSNVAMIPMGYPRISSFTSFFGYRSNPFDFGRHEFHPGLDFRGQVGDLVKCTASGRVIFTGRAGGYGNCVKIKHTSSLETWYGHLSHINVREGQEVTVGQVIGKVGSTGRSTGPHLHYEVRKNGKPVNPVQYLTLN